MDTGGGATSSAQASGMAVRRRPRARTDMMVKSTLELGFVESLVTLGKICLDNKELDRFQANQVNAVSMRTLRPSTLSRTLALIPPAVALIAQHSQAGFVTYLKIETIPGEVTEKGHEGWISVDNVNWGMSRTVSSPTGGGGAGRVTSLPSFSEVTVTKQIDKASPHLFLAAVVGKESITPIKIELVDSVTHLTFYRLTLDGVLVSSQNCIATSETAKAAETISMNFTKITVQTLGTTGNVLTTGSYDLTTNKPT